MQLRALQAELGVECACATQHGSAQPSTAHPSLPPPRSREQIGKPQSSTSSWLSSPSVVVPPRVKGQEPSRVCGTRTVATRTGSPGPGRDRAPRTVLRHLFGRPDPQGEEGERRRRTGGQPLASPVTQGVPIVPPVRPFFRSPPGASGRATNSVDEAGGFGQAHERREAQNRPLRKASFAAVRRVLSRRW